MKRKASRFVPDTNVLLSRLLSRTSVPGQAFEHAILHADLVICRETISEFEDVLSRPKFDKYLSYKERSAFLLYLRDISLLIESPVPITACRDSKDDKFLALALTGQAEFILSGDEDLLTLHPFRGIDILNPRQYLDRQRV